MRNWKTSKDLREEAQNVFRNLKAKRISVDTARALGANLRTAASLINYEMQMMKAEGIKPVDGQLVTIKLSR